MDSMEEVITFCLGQKSLKPRDINNIEKLYIKDETFFKLRFGMFILLLKPRVVLLIHMDP